MKVNDSAVARDKTRDPNGRSLEGRVQIWGCPESHLATVTAPESHRLIELIRPSPRPAEYYG